MKFCFRKSPAIFASAVFVLCLPVLWLNAQSPDAEKPQGDPVLGERIGGGIVFDGKLWLRGVYGSRKGFSGGLISLDLANDSRQVHFENGVLDMEKVGRDLWVMRRASLDAEQVVFSVWSKDRFEDLERIPFSNKDEPIALLDSALGPVVLSLAGTSHPLC